MVVCLCNLRDDQIISAGMECVLPDIRVCQYKSMVAWQYGSMVV